MTLRLNISAPATLRVLDGPGTPSSIDMLPPGGVSVSGAASGTLALQVIAGNAGAMLSASASAGATVSSDGNTLSISGTQAEVNAALASLEVVEPGGATGDVLTLAASDPGFVGTQTNIAVDVVPTTGPAFVAPKQIVTLQPNALEVMPDLLLSDPIASGLAAMGLGQEETLTLTLAVTSGMLFLPGYTDASAIAANGLGTGTITLSFTADDIGALNDLLAGLEFAGQAGGEHLDYALRDASGVLPDVLTYGNIYLNIVGSAGTGVSLAAGSQGLVLGSETLSGTLAVTGTTSVLGDISGTGAVVVAPDASLELPYNALALSGTSLDFGNIEATTLSEAGTLVVGDGASLGGPVLLGPGALLDFTGTLEAEASASLGYAQAVSLGAGAVLTGDGTLFAGNFSEAGLITGPGTLLAGSGETLSITAGSVGGGADLEVASGGVMVLGAVSPLYGVFDATALTLDSSVMLSFVNNPGAAGISGIYADTLGGDGGAFVINGPETFSGTILGFAPGDQLIFPGLSDLSLSDVGASSFTVTGLDGDDATDTYEIYASMAAGSTVFVGQDAEGDSDVMLRPAASAAVFPADMVFDASAGIAQPLLGLSLAPGAATTQSMNLTLAVAHGVLSDGTLGPAATITLNAMGVGAMDAELAGLTYTGAGIADTLTLSSNSGVLNGLTAYAAIEVATPGTVSGDSASAASEVQVVVYSAESGLSQVTAAIAAGELVVAGTTEFADLLQVDGISGTSLLVGDGATAIFNDATTAIFGQDVTLGAANGAGTLAVLGGVFSGGGNMTLAASAGAGGSAAYVLGALTLAGTLDVGVDAAANVALGGSLSAAAAVLGADGTIFAYGSAVADFGSIADGGAITLDNAASAEASSLLVSGALTLGGVARVGVGGVFEMVASSTLQVGTDATLAAKTIELMGGVVSEDGLLSASGAVETDALVTLGGGTISGTSLGVAATLQGDGVLNAATLVDDGVISAQGGTLALDGDVVNYSVVEVGPSAALDLAGSFSGGDITFVGGDGLVTVDDAANFSTGLLNFSATDAIDLVGVAPSLVSYSGETIGALRVFTSLGDTVSMFGIEVASGQPGLSIVSDGAGGALITMGDELPCFARGTGLLTPHGYRAVETLKPGDPLITANGIRRPVRWIGWRTLDLGPGTARFARPVLIMPGAFGQGMPARMLRLSPLHCVYADGVLIPATHLVNGATILREEASVAMTYYHVELDRHDILLAEGLACESYFDAGNRGGLYHEMGRRSPGRRPVAPTVTHGARLAAVRRRLHELALAAGFSLTYWPVLRAVARGQTVLPEIRQVGRWRMASFSFAEAVREITLLSETISPADTNPDSEDRRELGVCLEETGGVRLGEGFYPRSPGDDGVWMGKPAPCGWSGPRGC